MSIYIKAIDVLKLLDPSTVLLEEVSEPIKQYLLAREETLRCLVNTIFDKEQRLFEQLDNQRYVAHPQKMSQQQKNMSKLAQAVLPGQKAVPKQQTVHGEHEGWISSDEDENAAE